MAFDIGFEKRLIKFMKLYSNESTVIIFSKFTIDFKDIVISMGVGWIFMSKNACSTKNYSKYLDNLKLLDKNSNILKLINSFFLILPENFHLY